MKIVDRMRLRKKRGKKSIPLGDSTARDPTRPTPLNGALSHCRSPCMSQSTPVLCSCRQSLDISTGLDEACDQVYLNPGSIHLTGSLIYLETTKIPGTINRIK